MLMEAEQVSAIIVAGGESRRMGGVDKIRSRLGGKPLLVRTISVFQACPAIQRIVVVVAAANLRWCRRLVRQEALSKVAFVCRGGDRRQDSVANGLKRVGRCQWVMVHDGARPLVTEDIILDGLKAAQETGAAIAAVPVKDTIKRANRRGIVEETLSRDTLWSAQTPQVFRRDIIKEAYCHLEDDVTDDASLVERLGHSVKLYMGSYDNIKVTTPADLIMAELLLWRRECLT